MQKATIIFTPIDIPVVVARVGRHIVVLGAVVVAGDVSGGVALLPFLRGCLLSLHKMLVF